MMKTSILFFIAALAASVSLAETMSVPPTVKNVSCSQGRYTQNVTINYTLEDTVDPVFVKINVFTNGVSVGAENIKSVSGDISNDSNLFFGEGDHSIVWEARRDIPGLLMTNITISVEAVPAHRLYLIPGVYMVIDISGGPDAETYPVRYTFDGSGALSDTAKTSEIWLRCLPSSKFVMGSPESELDRSATWEAQHEVTLTKVFLAGLYEITEQQYYNVMGGTEPSEGSAKCAIGSVSWNSIRGESSNWPNIRSVETDSFMGKLRKKTGMNVGFDLPTEAQWEYACRAGTTTAWNNGTTNISMTAVDNRDPELDKLAWYGRTVNSPQEVGLKEPNAWGLYDMHGNQSEWTLNYSTADNTDECVDPVGPESANQSDSTLRIARGGSWFHSGSNLRSAYRSFHYQPNKEYVNLGFRLFFRVD